MCVHVFFFQGDGKYENKDCFKSLFNFIIYQIVLAIALKACSLLESLKEVTLITNLEYHAENMPGE